MRPCAAVSGEANCRSISSVPTPLRDGDIEGIHIERVAQPFHGLAARADQQSRELIDRSVGRMVAGQPLRVLQHQLPGFDGDGLVHTKEPARDITGVDAQRDRPVVGNVLRLGSIGPRHTVDSHHRQQTRQQRERSTHGKPLIRIDAGIKSRHCKRKSAGVPPARQLRDHGGPSDIDCRQDRRGDLRRQPVLAPGVTTLTRSLLTLTLAAAGISRGERPMSSSPDLRTCTAPLLACLLCMAGADSELGFRLRPHAVPIPGSW